MSNIVTTKVEFCRNVKGFPFCSKLGDNQSALLELIFNTCKDVKLATTNLSDVNDEVVDNLKAKFLLDKNFTMNTFSAFASNLTNDAFVEIGNIDHIRIGGLGENIYTAYDKAKKLDKQFCNKLNFMYNDKYGFLTPNLQNIGSGIIVKVYVMLPAITKLNIQSMLKKACEKMMFSVVNLSNGLYEVCSGANLGLTEKQVLEHTDNYIKKILKLEQEACKQLAQNQDEILDKTLRAKAILRSCFLIDTNELCELVGDILIAINSGLENEFSNEKICNLLLNISSINNSNKNNKELAKNIKNILNK